MSIKIYAYFVSYNYSDELGLGSGSMEITRNCPIEDFDDVENVRCYIKDYNKFKTVHITNWIELKPRKQAIMNLQNKMQ